VDRRDGAVAVVDGDGGPGQIAGLFATDLSVELARSFGIGAVSVHSSNHYGAAGIYAARAARAGMVGMSTTNADPLAVPFGGARKALGTNPIAFAAPTDGGVFVLDMATSQVAANKVFNARDEGRNIPEGWAVDESGAAITDPTEFYAVVPLGGYKGYGLALMVEVLSGVLGGAGVTHDVAGLFANLERPQGLGHFHLALDPERTVGRERFASVLSGLLDELRAIPPAPAFDEVLVAGDPEERAERERSADGIPLPDALVGKLEALSGELDVPVP
jgi:LDH2 family malate/lactate/ureidoglycolate dehydrogenase